MSSSPRAMWKAERRVMDRARLRRVAAEAAMKSADAPDTKGRRAMPVFRRRNETPLERELSATRERRDKLKGQRTEAQRALDLALAERRRTLVEADADDGLISRDLVRGARDLLEQLEDAIAHLDARITGIEHKIAAEQEKSRREQAAGELARYADALAAAVGSFEASIAMLAKAIPDVVGRTPLANLEYGRGVERLLSEVATELHLVVTNAKTHCAALLTAETVTIRRPEAPVEVLPSAPEIERTPLLILADNVKWREGDAVKTAPRYGYASPPRPAAERAIAACLAVLADSDVARRLREGDHHNAVGNSWHKPAQHLCIDIDRTDLKPARGAIGQSIGAPPDPEKPAGVPGVAGAVERIGPERVGVASAERVS
jgi:hypothetical protein